MKQHVLKYTGIRGLACLFVVFSHAANIGFVLVDGFSVAGHGSGQIGVRMFFILSAFLLTYQFERAQLLTPYNLFVYLSRRILRIYPAFIVCVVLVYMLDSHVMFFKVDDFSVVTNHLLLFQGKKHLWTVAVEFKYYLFIPFIGCMLRRKSRNIVIGVLLLLLALKMVAIATLWDAGLSRLSLLKYVEYFLFGSILAGCMPQREYQLAVPYKNALVALGTVCLVLCVPRISNALFGVDFIQKNSVVMPLLICAFMWSAMSFTTVFDRIFSNGVFVYFGKISFSMYLWHFPILLLLRENPPCDSSHANAVLFYVLTFMVSAASYYLVERSFMRLYPNYRYVQADCAPALS